MSEDDKLNDRVDTVASEVFFTGEVQKLVREGKLIWLAVVFYRPEDDALVLSRSQKMPKEEVDAVLRKFQYLGTVFDAQDADEPKDD